VHLNSLGFDEMKRLTMEHFPQRQNLQISRVFSVADPYVTVVFVTPLELT